MNQYSASEFSMHHQNGNINETVNYLNSIHSMTENDIIDVLLKMMRCNDTDAWTKPIMSVLISKYHGHNTFLKIVQKSSITRALEQA